MTDKPIINFGSLDENDRITLSAVKADVAVLGKSIEVHGKQLDRIEASVSPIPAILAQMQAETKQNTILIAEHRAESKTRFETVETNKSLITQHGLRIDAIERDIIPDGKLRIGLVEEKIGTREKTRKETIRRVVEWMIFAVLGWGGINLVGPYAGTLIRMIHH